MTKRILIADDEPLIRMNLRETLQEQGYLVVGEVGDGQSAVNLTRQLRPDLVLLDMQLPDGPGVDLLRTVRQDAQLRGTPVVIVSADLFPEGVTTALRAGANAYLSKPYDFDAVLAQIDTLLA